MSLSIEKEKLLNVIQRAYPIIPLKTSLQILSNFRLMSSASRLEITATDLDQSIRILEEEMGDDSFDITVNARKIFEIVRELPEGKTTISVENNVLTIASGKNFSCKIAGADAHDFPGFPEISSGVEFEIHSLLLKTMIPKCVFAVAKDESRACLAGIFWEVYPDRTVMVATDGHRLGSSSIRHKISIKEKMQGIVSPKSLQHLVRILDGNENEKIRVLINEKYVSFSGNNFILCSKLIEGPYPDYGKVIPASNPKEAIIERSLILNAVKRASILANQKTHLIKLNFSKEELEVCVVNKEIGGEAKEKITIDYRGDDHTIGFNGQYLAEIIDIVKAEKIVFKMNTQISACIIVPKPAKPEDADSDDVFLIMPLRIMEG